MSERSLPLQNVQIGPRNHQVHYSGCKCSSRGRWAPPPVVDQVLASSTCLQGLCQEHHPTLDPQSLVYTAIGAQDHEQVQTPVILD